MIFTSENTGRRVGRHAVDIDAIYNKLHRLEGGTPVRVEHAHRTAESFVYMGFPGWAPKVSKARLEKDKEVQILLYIQGMDSEQAIHFGTRSNRLSRLIDEQTGQVIYSPAKSRMSRAFQDLLSYVPDFSFL